MATNKDGTTVNLEREMNFSMYAYCYKEKILAPDTITIPLSDILEDLNERGIQYTENELCTTLNNIPHKPKIKPDRIPDNPAIREQEKLSELTNRIRLTYNVR